MTARERGFLLLTSKLGDPDRKPLTAAQFRRLAKAAAAMEPPIQDRELEASDLMALGYGEAAAQRLQRLLAEEPLLQYYLDKGAKAGCYPMTRISQGYPARLRSCLGLDSPGSLWYKGDAALLQTPCVALVGSRELQAQNRDFAREVGRQAAMQGYTLVSGNARGADTAAQEACLEAGGRVISVVADALQRHRERERLLYLAEESYDAPFSAQRALGRNRIIHALGDKTFVAQCGLSGGTWDGTTRNLRQNLSSVYCFSDGSAAMKELEQMGARCISIRELTDFATLPREENLFTARRNEI